MSSIFHFQSKLSCLKDFYKNEFSLLPALDVIGMHDFHRREFGFQIVKNKELKFVRNVSFSKPKLLLDYILYAIPIAIYVGAIYSEGPNYRIQKPIGSLQWIKRELIFDLDLTDYDTVRNNICDCKGKNAMCNRCWPLINIGMKWIHETLTEDFGIKNIKWFFSGRRGVHAWIQDHEYSLLNSEQRAAIVEYLTFFKGDGDTAKFSPMPKFNPNFISRVQHLLFETYFEDISKNQLIGLGFSKIRAGMIFDKLYKSGYGVSQDFLANNIFVKHKLSNLVPRQVIPSGEEIRNKILLNWSPRIDSSVTIDIRRILRLPGSIHGESGRLVRSIKESEIESYDPFQEDSIY